MVEEENHHTEEEEKEKNQFAEEFFVEAGADFCPCCHPDHGNSDPDQGEKKLLCAEQPVAPEQDEHRDYTDGERDVERLNQFIFFQFEGEQPGEQGHDLTAGKTVDCSGEQTGNSGTTAVFPAGVAVEVEKGGEGIKQQDNTESSTAGAGTCLCEQPYAKYQTGDGGEIIEPEAFKCGAEMPGGQYYHKVSTEGRQQDQRDGGFGIKKEGQQSKAGDGKTHSGQAFDEGGGEEAEKDIECFKRGHRNTSFSGEVFFRGSLFAQIYCECRICTAEIQQEIFMAGMYHNNGPFILASGSPRRQEFMRWMGLNYTVESADIDESRWPGEAPESYVCRLAGEKGRAVATKHLDSWVVSGDTIVCLDDDVLGKPENEEHAVEMLMRLSGRRHVVLSAWSILNLERGISENDFCRTAVTFTNFPESVARAYVATGEPLDKAGAYGIQYRGVALVQEIEGSYSNVVGMPLAELMAALVRLGAVSAGGKG